MKISDGGGGCVPRAGEGSMRFEGERGGHAVRWRARGACGLRASEGGMLWLVRGRV